MPTGGDNKTRSGLAYTIIGVSIVGIAAISIFAIVEADSKDRGDTTQLVFSAVLPLFGTWVGTVLAFYFARENLQAATQSTLAIQGRLDGPTPASQVMIAAAQMIAYDMGATEKPADMELTKLRDRMTAFSPPSRRLPIRDPSGAVLYVLHDSTLSAYAQEQLKGPLAGTLADLLEVPEFADLIKAIGYIAESATVADARAAMRSVPNCNDVFVTKSGKAAEPVLGWLTNTLLAGIE